MELYPYFHIAPKLLEAAQRAEELARPQFREIESIQRYNQQKMLAAFIEAGVSERSWACGPMACPIWRPWNSGSARSTK